jgi:hypothetical protein
VVLIIGLGVFIAYRISTRQIAQEIISGTESAVKKDEEPVTQMEATKTVTSFVEPVAEAVHDERKIEKRTGENRHTYAERDSLLEVILLKNDSIMLPEIVESWFLNPDGLPGLPAPGALNKLLEVITPDDQISADLTSAELKPVEKAVDPEKRHGGRTLMAGFSGLIAQSGGTASPSSGLSMGFYLDQKITKKISVRPGLALAIQSFGLDDGNSPTGFNYPISLNDGTNGIPYSYNGQLSMLAMELPLNIVFRIVDKERSGFYVSAGTSTMFYISQQYTADFVNEYTKLSFNTMTGEFSSETRYSTIEVEKDYGVFSRADFFGLANLSAGYSFPYSKTGTMLIEPFLQLPISDLTSLNLRVRYGGVSMKLRFGKQEREK